MRARPVSPLRAVVLVCPALGQRLTHFEGAVEGVEFPKIRGPQKLSAWRV